MNDLPKKKMINKIRALRKVTLLMSFVKEKLRMISQFNYPSLIRMLRSLSNDNNQGSSFNPFMHNVKCPNIL